MKEPIIGMLREKGLHQDIKEYLLRPGDRLEFEIDGFVADIFRDGQIIEVQTGNFGSMRTKLVYLLERYPVHLVHPIAQEKIIIHQDEAGREIRRIKSPKRGKPIEIFRELVSIRDMIMHPNLTLEILMIIEEEFRSQNPKKWRNGGWHVNDNRLVEVVDSTTLASARDFRWFIPETLDSPFTNRDLACALECSIRDASAITYTLRHIGVLQKVGRRGRSILYI